MKNKDNYGAEELGIAWYSQAEWKRFKESAVDRDIFHDRYGQWLENVERHMRGLRSQGYLVVKVPMQLEDFLKWSKVKKAKNNANARSAYVVETMQKQGAAGQDKELPL